MRYKFGQGRGFDYSRLPQKYPLMSNNTKSHHLHKTTLTCSSRHSFWEMGESTERMEELLAKKTGAVSVIWMWFGFRALDNQQKNIICEICRVTVIAKRDNTSNLFCHLKTKHVIEYEERQRMRLPQTPSQSPSTSGRKEKCQQTSITNAFSKGTLYDKKSQWWN